jgi:hypothetical protein
VTNPIARIWSLLGECSNLCDEAIDASASTRVQGELDELAIAIDAAARIAMRLSEAAKRELEQ